MPSNLSPNLLARDGHDRSDCMASCCRELEDLSHAAVGYLNATGVVSDTSKKIRDTPVFEAINRLAVYSEGRCGDLARKADEILSDNVENFLSSLRVLGLYEVVAWFPLRCWIYWMNLI